MKYTNFSFKLGSRDFKAIQNGCKILKCKIKTCDITKDNAI